MHARCSVWRAACCWSARGRFGGDVCCLTRVVVVRCAGCASGAASLDAPEAICLEHLQQTLRRACDAANERRELDAGFEVRLSIDLLRHTQTPFGLPLRSRPCRLATLPTGQT